jgi:hypothetical protein
MAALAVAGLAGLMDRAVAQPLALRPAARALAGSGLVVPAAVRRALDGVLREHG